MGLRWAFVLALGGCARPEAAAVRAWHAGETLRRVEAERVWDVPGVVVARCDTQDDWWGFFGCYGIEGGRVAWQASVDEAPSEQSVHRVRGGWSDVLGAPLIEVVGKTHMGNGSLYVYELRDRALRLVLRTRAYDANNHEGLVFRGGALDVDVRGREIALSGTIEGDDRAWPCRKVFVWDAARRHFAEDVARRSGWELYPEPETWPPR